MTLVETTPVETDADFRAAMDAFLQAIIPHKPSWWHPYEVRGTYEYDGIRFREFFCVAGSVELWIWTEAKKRGSRRVIVVPDESVVLFDGVKMVGDGKEVPVMKERIKVIATG